MSESVPDALKRVLFYYGLEPIAIRPHGKRFQIFTKDNIYSLKKVTSKQNLSRSLQTRNKLLALSLNVPPIITTTDGLRYVTVNGETYYVTPWLEEVPFSNQRKSDILVDYLSYIHHATVELEPIEDPRKVDEGLEHLERRWKGQLDGLTAFVQRSDHRIYPSPFEQLVAAHYAMFVQKTHRAIQQLEVWREHVKEMPMQRLVQCLGKPDLSHLIFHARGPMVINMEYGGLDTPIRDLATMFDSPHFHSRDWVKSLNLYETTFPLRESEKELLLGFLHYPGSIFETVMAYESSELSNKELHFIEQFERIHHQEPKRAALIEALAAQKEKDQQSDETP
ncbi:hypothetical protein GCM10011391_21760 [Pullulanibacillus camelliae]|uniref:Aminoglycoside phosphotransferase domain-containing protein n=1 Tax=Pullulanibacillus camelliae TaxID=1707096 RepID=A0A8J2YHB5_9BACL|nr:hypothetical protein [Pullulanibacillus camelliae]GGE42605.1 hypothetical protein GCM10011391_21760 [Pullulanibacillus camelliae]